MFQANAAVILRISPDFRTNLPRIYGAVTTRLYDMRLGTCSCVSILLVLKVYIPHYRGECSIKIKESK